MRLEAILKNLTIAILRYGKATRVTNGVRVVANNGKGLFIHEQSLPYLVCDGVSLDAVMKMRKGSSVPDFIFQEALVRAKDLTHRERNMRLTVAHIRAGQFAQ